MNDYINEWDKMPLVLNWCFPSVHIVNMRLWSQLPVLNLLHYDDHLVKSWSHLKWCSQGYIVFYCQAPFEITLTMTFEEVKGYVLPDRPAPTVCIIILWTATGVYYFGLRRYNRAQQLLSQSWTVSLRVKIAICYLPTPITTFCSSLHFVNSLLHPAGSALQKESNLSSEASTGVKWFLCSQ